MFEITKGLIERNFVLIRSYKNFIRDLQVSQCGKTRISLTLAKYFVESFLGLLTYKEGVNDYRFHIKFENGRKIARFSHCGPRRQK